MWFNIFLFTISCSALVYAGMWAVKSLTRIAQFLGWKEFIVASVSMAFITSLPEFFIGITSAIHKKPELSFGDIIGSNIIALTLVIGLGAILAKGLKFDGKILQKSAGYASVIALMPLLLLIDGKISRIDGIILILISIVYFHHLLSKEERFSKVLSNVFNGNSVSFKLFLKDMGIFLGSACLMLLSAEGIVSSILNIAKAFHMPLVTIGMFLVAIGTSLPEITFGIRSATTKHKGMILGDILGSVVINSTLVLGIVALICPFQVYDFSPYFSGIIFTTITCLLFVFFARTGHKITRKEAYVLLCVYVLFVFTQFI